MACECISCPDCGGSGSVWVSFSGEYLGTRRCDDLDELECCDSCGGSGVSWTCAECGYALEEEEERRQNEEFDAMKRDEY